jgi:type VI secretion system secreted protein Hcp
MATDYFLKLEGPNFEGESSKMDKQIDVLSWSWGESNPGQIATGKGLSAGKVSASDLNLMFKLNKSSPYIIKACASGEHIKSATLTCRRSGTEPQDYLIITLSPVVVSSYQTSGSSGGDDLPIDSVSLTFAKIEYKYAPQKADGKLDKQIPIAYDYSAGKAG